MIKQNLSEYRVSITNFNESIEQDQNGETKHLTDENATVGYDQNLKSWYIKAFDEDLSLGLEKNRFPTVLHLFEYISERSYGYVVNSNEVKILLQEDLSLRIKNSNQQISKFFLGSGSTESNELFDALNILIALYIKFDFEDRHNSHLNFHEYMKPYNAQIHKCEIVIIEFAEQLPNMSLYDMQQISESYVDYYKVLHRPSSWPAERLSNFTRLWDGINDWAS